MTTKLQIRTISGENQFTDPVELVGYFNLSITGSFNATVTVQRSFDSGSTWYDVDSWTENTQEYAIEPERGVWYRVGCKDGEHNTGAITVRLSQ